MRCAIHDLSNNPLYAGKEYINFLFEKIMFSIIHRRQED